MKSSRRGNGNRTAFSSSANSTTVTYAFHSDLSTPTSQPNSTQVPITVNLSPQLLQSNDDAATKIQSAYRAHQIRSLYKTISAVDSETDRLQRLIQLQETVDTVRSEEREKIRMNEALMRLLLKLDSVPGIDPTVREARRKVSRRIVGLQEILDAITESKVSEGDYGDYWMTRNWDDVVAEMEEEVCRERGGEEMERFCAQHLGFRCFQRFLREP